MSNRIFSRRTPDLESSNLDPKADLTRISGEVRWVVMSFGRDRSLSAGEPAIAAPINPIKIRDFVYRSDADLMQALQKGHTDALGALYDRHAGVVFGIALKTLGNSEDAEDLTQEIFLQLWRKPKVYNASRGALRSYLSTLTRSRAIDLLRSRTSKFNVLQRCRRMFLARGTADSLLDMAAGAEQARVVQIALAKLPERQREVLCLRFYERYSFSQIAQHLELPLGTVKSRSRQGLLALRSHMAAITPPARPNPSDL